MARSNLPFVPKFKHVQFAAIALTTAFLSTVALPTAALAQRTVWSNPGEGDWQDAANWTAGVPSGLGQVEISNGGTAVIDGSSGQAASVNIGAGTGDGALSIVNGGIFSFIVPNRIAYVGDLLGSVATLTVDGANSRWNGSDADIQIQGAEGTVTVSNGGAMDVRDVSVASADDTKGTVNVTTGGSFTARTADFGRGAGVATLNVMSGGTAIFTNTLMLGWDQNSSGTANVTGPGSTLSVGAGGLRVGEGLSSRGFLNVSDGGIVRADGGTGTMGLGTGPNASGILTIGSASGSPAAPGYVEAARVALSSTSQVVFNHTSNSYTFIPQITGAGGVVIAGGTTVLTGANSYAGGTSLLGGIISASADANLGDVTGALTFNGGVLRVTGTGYTSTDRAVTIGAGGGGFDIADAGVRFEIRSDIVGNGDLIKRGMGTLVLSGENAYGNTRVEEGWLIGDANSISGNIANAGTVRFIQDGDARFAGDIAGLGATSGTMVKEGAGTLRLEGRSRLNWRITGGGLATDAARFGGDALLDGVGTMFRFGDTGNAIYDGAISGNGAFSFNGTGSVLLTGDSSVFSGTTAIAAGTLRVGGADGNGALGGSFDVLDGGTLGGSGTIGSGAGSLVMVASGGTLSPGNSIGTLNVAGNVTFGPGSFYDVEINGAGQSDRIAATGNASLNGGTVRIFADQGQYSLSPYTILTAGGGVTGRFAGTEAGAEFAFVTPVLGYGTSTVTLTLVRKVDPQPPTPTPVAFHSVAVSSNQYNTADAVEALGAGNRLFDTVIGASVAGARQAFDALSGEAHASAVTAAYADMLRVQDTILNRLSQAGPLAQVGDLVPPSFDPRSFALWGAGFGSWGKVRSDGNAASIDTSTGGFIIGADGEIGETYRIGIAGGFTSTSFDIDGRLSSGTTETIFGSIYGASKWDAFNVRLGALYAHHDVDVNRTVAFPGFSDRVGSSYDGSTLMAFGEVGYEVNLGGVTLEPFLGASVMRLHMDGFREDGGPAALVGYGRTYELGTTTLGVRGEAKIGLDLPLTGHGMVGWRHGYGDVRPSALLAFAGGASAFNAAGIPIDRDTLVAEAGLDWQIGKAMTLGVFYSGQIGKRAQVHEVKGSLNWRFETW